MQAGSYVIKLFRLARARAQARQHEVNTKIGTAKLQERHSADPASTLRTSTNDYCVLRILFYKRKVY